MNKLDDLIQKYPLLFTTDKNEPFGQFGFECGNGWYNLIDSACASIYAPFKQAKRNLGYYSDNKAPDFAEKMQQAIDKLDERQLALPVFEQIKEKFGSLRIYYSGGDERAHGIIDVVERLSETTCQLCGNVIDKSQYSTKKFLCAAHKPK